MYIPPPQKKSKTTQELRPHRAPATRGRGADAGGPLNSRGGVCARGRRGSPGLNGRGAAQPPYPPGDDVVGGWGRRQGAGAGGLGVSCSEARLLLLLLPDPGIVRPHVLRRPAPPPPSDVDADADAGVAVRGA